MKSVWVASIGAVAIALGGADTQAAGPLSVEPRPGRPISDGQLADLLGNQPKAAYWKQMRAKGDRIRLLGPGRGSRGVWIATLKTRRGQFGIVSPGTIRLIKPASGYPLPSRVPYLISQRVGSERWVFGLVARRFRTAVSALGHRRLASVAVRGGGFYFPVPRNVSGTVTVALRDDAGRQTRRSVRVG